MAVEKIHTLRHRMLGLFPVVNSYVAEGDDLTIIDTGVDAASARSIVRKLGSIEKRLSDVDLCIITHAHRDHVGGLRELKKGVPPFLIAAHDAEADEVEKATGLEVDLRLIDEQNIGGFTVIYVPGHTLGSIALLGGGTLIAGDAINGGGAELSGPNPMFTKDRGLALASVRHLAGFDFDRVLVGHGAGVETGGKEAVERLVARLGEPV